MNIIKANFSEIAVTDMEFMLINKRHIKDNGKTTINRVTVLKRGEKDNTTMAHGLRGEKMVLDSFTLRMGASTKAIFAAMKSTGMEFIVGRIPGLMKGIGNIILCVGKEY